MDYVEPYCTSLDIIALNNFPLTCITLQYILLLGNQNQKQLLCFHCHFHISVTVSALIFFFSFPSCTALVFVGRELRFFFFLFYCLYINLKNVCRERWGSLRKSLNFWVRSVWDPTTSVVMSMVNGKQLGLSSPLLILQTIRFCLTHQILVNFILFFHYKYCIFKENYRDGFEL